MNEKYMKRAIELAKLGIGHVNPNPMVGAVIVKNNTIIGEGYHEKYGCLHAERSAFCNLVESAEDAEMYVTLEPCCHYGKQPPCIEAIIENKISRVYVGSDDPNELVRGKGIIALKNAGIDVITGILKDECDEINRVFFHYIVNKTPYVVMKYAMSMDGKIAAYTGEARWISNDQSREHTHFSRNWLKGIMVGVNTIINDNPLLNCRITGGRNPIRIICDTNLRIPLDCNLVNTAMKYPVIIATEDISTPEKEDKMKFLRNAGVEFVHVPTSDGVIDLKILMKKLGERQIDGILLEGGGTLNFSAIKMGIVNEIHAYIAPKILGGNDAPTPVGGKGFSTPDDAEMFELCDIETINGDVLLKYRRR